MIGMWIFIIQKFSICVSFCRAMRCIGVTKEGLKQDTCILVPIVASAPIVKNREHIVQFFG